MKNICLICLTALFLFNACHPSSGTDNSGDASFQKLADDYLKGYLAWRPQTGTYLGLHEYDGKITDYSKASIDAELARLKDYRQKLAGIDTARLSTKMYHDYRILKDAIDGDIFNIEDLGAYYKNPMTYAGALDVNIYVKRNFAPLEDRLRSLIAIEKEVPKIFAAAKANLEDSLAKPYIDLAIDVAKGSSSFLSGDLPVALKDVKNDSLMKEFNQVNRQAVEEINNYVSWLQKEKLPKAHNHYAIGKEKFAKLLATEEIYLSPDSILAIGMQELKKEQAVFDSMGKIIDPTKKPIEVYMAMQKEHPTAQSLIPDARKSIESIRQYLIDHKLVTMPSEVRVKVEETLPYARSTSTASMDTPGPFEEKATEAYYYITPVDPKWTPKQAEDWLQEFNYFSTDIFSIHEAYPGHYTQFLHLNASDASKIEKIFGSYAYIEGWAHYAEKMMVDEGFGNDGDKIKAAKFRMAQSGESLLRICRLCVSINTHCHGMTVDEATEFFMDNWHQGDKPSRQEALRGTFDPGYLFYTLGKLQILKLREDYKKQEGANFSLQKFHDRMLDNGMPPIRILREILLKDKSQWPAIL